MLFDHWVKIKKGKLKQPGGTSKLIQLNILCAQISHGGRKQISPIFERHLSCRGGGTILQWQRVPPPRVYTLT